MKSFFFLCILLFGMIFYGSFAQPVAAASFHGKRSEDQRITVVPTPINGGIRENIPDKYKAKFAKWKDEFLSTAFGREQWENYASNKNFILTITIAGDRNQGAGTDQYLWNEDGRLVGATITLGNKIDKGYPNPIYYPVMNSLSPENSTYSIDGNLLAATKLAHEIGHVNQTVKANLEIFKTQNKLMPVYIAIFLSNGRNVKDTQLIELAAQMGGTPVEIWENREYWSEVNAMNFLNEKIRDEDYYCFVFNKIKNNVKIYAKHYEDRFDEIRSADKPGCNQ